MPFNLSKKALKWPFNFSRVSVMTKITLQDLIKDRRPKNEDDLVNLSDDVWAMGDLATIAQKLDQDAFNLFIATNVIGIWKGDGWGGVLEHNQLLPHVVPALTAMGLTDMAHHFEQLLTLFPFDPTDLNVADHFHDHLNFLLNPRFTVADERLSTISDKTRMELSNQFHEELSVLDDQAEALWAYDAPDQEGWGMVLAKLH
ncbi:hypothetical protein B9T11_02730 [Wohlfahrtiimonas chitiniclastica]|nr:hypothetical protein A6V30_01650 [Wohlfahrtiimonas chitiniclastica]OYQ71083.1 hypothetical protein B9T13_00015 [Wohlfahrtiimonas chitiniclastica]OYQ76747.1 hypothetical protein B9T18_05110 [Wohlfahrtiimonas chitiniclastica]OYQ83068.1 hypothetical protein B9T11_02730 [Wohlfahrtiimonas chitiniclastica]OYQ84900.1 hypothetical protein B9T14_00015 [Wohlfahrtiimonas chitiniclastica]